MFLSIILNASHVKYKSNQKTQKSRLVETEIDRLIDRQ